MKDLISDVNLYVEAQMVRKSTFLTVLLVEGDSDSRSLSGHIDSERTYVAIGRSKTAVLKAAKQASESCADRIIAVVDADLDRDLGIDHECDLVVMTEHYDLEADFFFLPRVASRIIGAFVDAKVLYKIFPHPVLENAIQHVFRAAGVVGLARLSSARNRLGLHLRELPFAEFLDSSAQLDFKKAAAIVHSKSTTGLRVEDVEQVLIESGLHYRTQLHWCCGHDLASALSVLISHWAGKKRKITRENIQDAIRAAVSDADFVKLEVYRGVNRVLSKWGGIVWRVDAARSGER